MNKLKIVFICTSLEEGRDGVGDYTRRLAAALIGQGHEAAAMAINDKHIASIYEGEQPANGTQVKVMRLPYALPAPERFALAKQWIDKIGPEWLSLQFVPFGFHPKGLKIGLSKWLLSLGGGRKWHIMIHELWVGMAKEEPAKLHYWGWLQRLLIGSLIKNIAPKVVHTQTQLYIAQLARLGLKAGYLPLFGNILVTGKPESDRAAEKKVVLVNFGKIHTGAPIRQLAKETAAYSRKNNIPVVLVILGICGAELNDWTDAWTSEGLHIEVLGEQPAERVSEVLTSATMGLATTALAAVEKSGGFAAMREHNLPVLCISKPWTPVGVPGQQVPAGIFEYVGGNFEYCLQKAKEIAPHDNSVLTVAEKFAAALLKA